MKISCVLPVYNAGPYLRSAIDSILNQTYKDFEIIIIDDNSNDDSWSTICEYQANFPQTIRSLRNIKNFGLPGTLNTAIKMSSGQLIARMDQDDISHENRFEEQFKYLNLNPQITILGSYWKYMNNGIVPVVPIRNEDIKTYTLLNNPIGHPTVMFRKNEIIEKVGFYNENAHTIEDYEFWCRCLDKVKAHNLPIVLLDYRIHSAQISSSSASKQALHLKSIRESQTQKSIKSKNLAKLFIDLYDSEEVNLLNFFLYISLLTYFILINIFTRTFNNKSLFLLLARSANRKAKTLYQNIKLHL